MEILRKLAGPPSCPAPRFQVSALHPSLSQILRGLCHGRFHFAFYPILHLYVFFLFYLSLCLVLLIPTDPTNTLLVTGIFFHLFVGVFISFCIFSSRLGIPTDCGGRVVSTFAILTPVPPPTTSANSPDSRPNLSHLSHFLSQILLAPSGALIAIPTYY